MKLKIGHGNQWNHYESFWAIQIASTSFNADSFSSQVVFQMREISSHLRGAKGPKGHRHSRAWNWRARHGQTFLNFAHGKPSVGIVSGLGWCSVQIAQLTEWRWMLGNIWWILMILDALLSWSRPMHPSAYSCTASARQVDTNSLPQIEVLLLLQGEDTSNCFNKRNCWLIKYSILSDWFEHRNVLRRKETQMSFLHLRHFEKILNQLAIRSRGSLLCDTLERHCCRTLNCYTLVGLVLH